MCASAYRRGLRFARIEECEPRIVMSADALLQIGSDYLDELAGDISTLATTTNSGSSAAADIRTRYGFTGAGQTVAVIDSGIAYDHIALGGGYGSSYRVVGGYDFTEERDYNPYDDGSSGSHGTHVAGIIGANGGKTSGVATGVDFVALRVFNDNGDGQISWVEEALRWVHQHRNDYEFPITTVNLSLGIEANTNSPAAGAQLEDELAQLRADGIFVVAAAGNSFQTYAAAGLTYPASSPYVVPVASTDADGSLSYYTQRSDRVIAAPGRSILSTVPDYMGNGNGIADDYARYSSTSMAAPYVAWAAVLMRQAYWSIGVTNVSADTLYSQMYNTADLVYDSATATSYHRLNLTRAIDAIMSQQIEPATDTVGVYNRAAASFSLSNSSTSGTVDQVFNFKPGTGNYTALSGDWNGDGTKSVGLYDPSTGNFYLRNSNSGGAADLSFGYGPAGAGWQAIVGDWNGDGIDTVGMYNSSSGVFYLRNANSSGYANIAFAYGPTGSAWQAIAGDWNGDGVDTIGLYNSTTGVFYLRNANSTGYANVAFAYGATRAGWTAVAGDWNGDGTSSIGLFDAKSGAFYLRNTNSSGHADVTLQVAGATGAQAIVGDWNGRLTTASTTTLSQTGSTALRTASLDDSASVAAAMAEMQVSSGRTFILGAVGVADETRLLSSPELQRATTPATLVEQRFDELWRAVSSAIDDGDSVDELDLSLHARLRGDANPTTIQHDLAFEQFGAELDAD